MLFDRGRSLGHLFRRRFDLEERSVSQSMRSAICEDINPPHFISKRDKNGYPSPIDGVRSLVFAPHHPLPPQHPAYSEGEPVVPL